MNSIQKEDIDYIHNRFDFGQLSGKTILISGATGLIGRGLVSAILEWNRANISKINVIALVRNKEKLRALFDDYAESEFSIVVADVMTLPIENMGVDYIIHCASSTSSKEFVEHPVEVVKTSVCGTLRMLELAKCNSVNGFVYLSSMEVYGTPSDDKKITEQDVGCIDALRVRNCYPESKRMCENLCAAYASEYDLPTRILRLTQTFGPGVEYGDNRVFAEFARCVIENRDIVLKTKGETKRCYLYTADAITAILTTMLNGENGAAYNAANESTYCSVYEMALIVSALSDSSINVIIEEQDVHRFGYAPTFKMNLSSEKLKKLGWNPEISLLDMYKRMILTMKANN